MTMLIGAMTSVIVIAGHAIPSNEDPQQQRLAAMGAVDQIAGDLFYADAISEATATGVTFTVPDRGHGAAGAETIRIAWSGTPGDPVTRQYNDGTPMPMCAGVQQLSLSFETDTTPLNTPPQILFVVANAGSLSAGDIARKNTMENWGFAVAGISGTATVDELNAAADACDIVYVVQGVDPTGLGSFVESVPRGVVNELPTLYERVGVSPNGTWTTATSLNIINNTHEITSVFSLGAVSILSSSDSMAISVNAPAGGTTVLGQEAGLGNTALQVIDAGGAVYTGGPAPSRRVGLPWAGKISFDFNKVNSDGLTLMRRAIKWAGAPVGVVGVSISLTLQADVTRPIETTVPILNRPRWSTS